MRSFCVLMMVAVVVELSGIGWVHAQGGKKVLTLSPADYAEIQHLAVRLNQGADFHDSEMWVSVWTPDGVWTRPDGREYEGHEGLAEHRRTRRAETGGRTETRHWTNSLVVTPTVDGATGRSYYMMMNVSITPPAPISAGHYEDVFAKTSDGWRIKRRIIKPYGAQ
jgi:hypothetical protein